jgi:hypothetical protein
MNHERTFKFISIILVAAGVILLLLMGLRLNMKPYVELTFSALLFFVTAIYVMLTHEILNDNKKSREITYIERQIEEFYIPLERFFNKYTKIIFSINPKSTNDIFNDSPKEFLEYMNNTEHIINVNDAGITVNGSFYANPHFELYRHRYLAIDGSKETTNRFLSLIEKGEKIKVRDMEKLIKDMYFILENDLNQLNDELDELTH